MALSTLWRYVKPNILHQTTPYSLDGTLLEEHFDKFYSRDEVVLCLRVVFAEWTEKFILRTCPLSFIRGLLFKTEEKLAEWKSKESETLLFDLQSISKRLKRCRTVLYKVLDSKGEQDLFYSKFIKCFREELNLIPDPSNNNLPDGLPQNLAFSSNLLRLPETEEHDEKKLGILFLYEVQSKKFLNKERTTEARFSYLDQCLLNLQSLTQIIENLQIIIERVEWQAEYFRDPEKLVRINPDLRQEPADNLRQAILTSFWREVENVRLTNIEFQQKLGFSDIFVTCSGILLDIDELLQSVERHQQISAIGIKDLETDIESDLNGSQSFSERLLMKLKTLEEWIASVNLNYQESQMQSLIMEMIPYSPEKANYYTSADCFCFLNSAEWYSSIQDIRLKLYYKAALCIRTQPYQVKKTDSMNSVSIKLFNFDNPSATPTNSKNQLENDPQAHIQVYLIDEETAISLKGRTTLPEPISEAGTLRITRRRRKRKSNSESVQYFSNQKYLHLNFDLLVSSVERKTKDGRVDHENVYRQKYAFLFVAEFPIYGKIKVWKTSLPMVIMTHTSQEEGGWSVIAWSNTFPSLDQSWFDIRVNGHQVCEMLKGVFQEWVGLPLKHSHVKYIKDKLLSCIHQKNINFDDGISWRHVCEDQRKGSFYFWSWFFRAAKVLKEYVPFKEAFCAGYIEAFISYEDASVLLRDSKVKPRTFVFRFSDSEPGSLSLIFLSSDRNTYRMKPCELYKQTGFKDCKKTFLELLDATDKRTGEPAFLWVYPNICKRRAFDKFYNGSPPGSPTQPSKKPHYVSLEHNVGASLPPTTSSSVDQCDTTTGNSDMDGHKDAAAVQYSQDEEFPDIDQLKLESSSSAVHSSIQLQEYFMEETVMEPQDTSLQGLVQDLLNYEMLLC